MDLFLAKYLVTGIFVGVHILAWRRGWYYRRPSIDTLTHFLGGLALSAWVKDWGAAIALIVGWEFLEMALESKKWNAFKETPLNKASDVLFGLLGYFIGVDML